MPAIEADLGLERVVATGSRPATGQGGAPRSGARSSTAATSGSTCWAWGAPKGRDAGGVLARRDGRVLASAFPALPSAERERLGVLLAENGVEVLGGVQLSAGWAEVDVGYLERLPTGRLREPVAQAVRTIAEARHCDPQGSLHRPDEQSSVPLDSGAAGALWSCGHLGAPTPPPMFLYERRCRRLNRGDRRVL